MNTYNLEKNMSNSNGETTIFMISASHITNHAHKSDAPCLNTYRKKYCMCLHHTKPELGFQPLLMFFKKGGKKALVRELVRES